jgi:hypothetical protein
MTALDHARSPRWTGANDGTPTRRSLARPSAATRGTLEVGAQDCGAQDFGALRGSSGGSTRWKSVRCVVALSLVSCALSGRTPVAAQETPSTQTPSTQTPTTENRPASKAQEAKDMLEQARDEVRRAQTEALEQRRTRVARLRELTSERNSAQRSVDAVDEEIERLRRILTDRQAKKVELEKETAAIRSNNSKLVELYRAYYSGVEARLESGIPWQIDLRLSSLEEARKAIAPDPQDPTRLPNVAGALSALARIQKEEEAFARLVESSALRLDLGDRQIEVTGFHLGLLAVVYANDDGSVSGYVRPGEKLEDGRRAVEGDPGAADGYIKAVDILKRRRTPEILDIFAPALPVWSKSGSSDSTSSRDDDSSSNEGAENEDAEEAK